MQLGLDNTLTQQRINAAVKAADIGGSQSSVLPYDPANPPDSTSGSVNIAANLIDNTDFDFSKNGYTASGAGDADYECYNFYRQLFIKLTDVVATSGSNAISSAAAKFASTYTYPMPFVLLGAGASNVALTGYLNRTANGTASLFTDAGMGTPLNASVTLTGGVLWFGTLLAENSANALKATGHSLFAANEGTDTIIPRWDRTHGWGELGSTGAESYDIACPLPVNFVRAGVRYYFRILIGQRSGATATDAARVSFGIWDATTARSRFLESSNMTLSVGPVGSTGATTYAYRIIADLDDGTSLMSDVTTITNGNASLSGSNYNRLTWANSSGVLRLRIYRSVGGVIKRVFTITNGANDFNDYGTDEGETPVSMPTTSQERPIAYKVSPQFTPPGAGSWTPFLLWLDIPTTYDSSTTTGKQWLRFTVEGTETDVRAFLFDRVMISTDNGGWQRSARDFNKIVSGVPTSVPPDDGGQGGGGIDDGRCFVLDTPVIRCDVNGENQQEVPIGEIVKGNFILDDNRVRLVHRKPKDGLAKRLVYVRLTSGVEFTCTPSEKFVTSRTDIDGTRIDKMTRGDIIQGFDRHTVEYPVIKEYENIELDEPVWVRTLMLKGGHTFLVGRLIGCRAIVERVRNYIRARSGREPQFRKARAHNEKPLMVG